MENSEAGGRNSHFVPTTRSPSYVSEGKRCDARRFVFMKVTVVGSGRMAGGRWKRNRMASEEGIALSR